MGLRPRVARIIAVGVAAAIGAVLAAPSAVLAKPPTAGVSCAGVDGKITGRGSTMQTWLQYDLIGAYAKDVCGAVFTLAIPGATYTGSADGGQLTFTVSSNGEAVTSYEIYGANGHNPDGSGCRFVAEGDAGVWPGATIAGNFFSYQVGSELLFEGQFTGAQSAAGTFEYAIPGGCDTGRIAWTAATTAVPLPDGYANGGDITDPGSPIYSLPNGQVYGSDWMAAYNYPSAQAVGGSGPGVAIGSAAGQTAIGCRAEAFAGSDIPITASQVANINGAVPVPGGTLNGDDCDPANGSTTLTTPFDPLPTAQGGSSTPAVPNPGDQMIGKGVMVFPVGLSAVSIFANLPSSCIPASGAISLSTADAETIWGGSATNWSQITDAGIVQPCNVAITRVVPSENSGATQAVDDYMADAFGYSSPTCQPSSATAGTFQELQNNEEAAGTNVNWPGGPPNSTPPAGCSPVISATSVGAPALISEVEATSGAVGFADYADVLHEAAGSASQVAGDAITVFGLQASSGATGVQPGAVGGGSNCNTTAFLPSGGTSGAVGVGGKWDVLAQSVPNQGPGDITFAREASYPICSILWDLVWAGEDGNTPPAPATSAAVTLPSTGTTNVPVSSVAGLPDVGSFTFAPTTTTTSGYTLPTASIAVASVAGLPTSGGSFTVVDSAGTETFSYTGITLEGGPAGTLTGVSGGTSGATITSGATASSFTSATTTSSGTGAGYTLPVPGGNLSLSSTALMPVSGNIAVADSAGIETLAYTGIDGNTLTGVSGGTSGATLAPGAAVTFPVGDPGTYTGLTAAPSTLTGVSAAAGTVIASGSTLAFPLGTGGPEADLTADQRRTEYSYFSYVLSPAAQSSEAPAGYAPLPPTWTIVIRAGFQNGF